MSKHAIYFLALAVAFAPVPALAQQLPGAEQVLEGVQTGKDIVDTVKNAPDKAIDAGSQFVKDKLPPELQPLADTAGTLAKDLSHLADGKAIADAVGATLDKFGSVISEVAGNGKELRDRLDRLEKENTEKMIEIEHAKASIAKLDTLLNDLGPKIEQGNAAMMELIEAQRSRIEALETRLAKLEADKGTVRAPFRVVDKDGFPLLLVDESSATFSAAGGGRVDIQLKQGMPPQIFLGSQQSGVSLEGGETSRLTMLNGDTAAFELKANASSGVMLSAKTSEGEVRLGSGPELTGILLKTGDQPAAGLGTFDGRGIALRLFSGGKTIAAMGENPKTAGTGLVYVGNGTRNAAALAVDGEGSGLVHAFAADGTVGAGLVGKERLVAAYNAGGAAVATLQKSEKSEGGSITARDPAGEGVFKSGFRADIGGGEACVIRNKRGGNVFCLGLAVPGFGLSP